MPSEDSDESVLDAIDDFESKVLEFDRLARGGADYRPMVHILFRLAHNLKGAFAVAGLDGAVGLLHAVESCLDALRTEGGKASGAIVDLLVSAVDALRRGSDDPGLRRALEAEAASLRSSKAEARSVPFALEEAELHRLEAATAGGASVYVLEKLVGAALDEAAIGELPVFETVASAGETIAWRIKRPEAEGKEAVLVVLFASPSDPEELGSLIFDPFFPVEVDSAAIPRGEKRASPPPAGGASSSALPHILLVDDEALSLILLQKCLVDYGRIDSASGGAEALARFQDALASAPYSVVFLDIMMDDMRGTDVLREMRSLERAAGVPAGSGARIVMSSSLRDFETVSLSFREQCELYLVKPIDSGKIREAMAKLGISPIGS